MCVFAVSSPLMMWITDQGMQHHDFRIVPSLIFCHCILNNHRIVILRPHRSVFIQCVEWVHFFIGQCKVEKIQILLHAVFMNALGYNNDAALNMLPKSNLCRGGDAFLHQYRRMN